MQIILLEKVTNLGNLGDVVKVKDGYARNFLIPTRAARVRPSGVSTFSCSSTSFVSVGWFVSVIWTSVATRRW